MDCQNRVNAPIFPPFNSLHPVTTLLCIRDIITLQGGNEVCFFFADPIFVRKFLILDSKSVTHIRP